MADPPWDIHMELPYGTMADDEMRNLNVPALQTDGLIFLWVTGRAMELGREWYLFIFHVSLKERAFTCSWLVFQLRSLGVQARGRDHMGEDESASEDHKDGENGTLAEPQQRALPGWDKRRSAGE